ncbi:unnamed protein product [Closterium sp. Yama58-4]|nr:unnamed protein product [Closterium sp. Yama58-4]CAI5479779.1 unnamed protein product [Closterium sp. Yama58-4]
MFRGRGVALSTAAFVKARRRHNTPAFHPLLLAPPSSPSRSPLPFPLFSPSHLPSSPPPPPLSPPMLSKNNEPEEHARIFFALPHCVLRTLTASYRATRIPNPPSPIYPGWGLLWARSGRGVSRYVGVTLREFKSSTNMAALPVNKEWAGRACPCHIPAPRSVPVGT